jgi:hypothetical protein
MGTGLVDDHGANYLVLGAFGGMTNGPTYTFSLDTMSRLNLMTRIDGTAATIANNVLDDWHTFGSSGTRKGDGLPSVGRSTEIQRQDDFARR